MKEAALVEAVMQHGFEVAGEALTLATVHAAAPSSSSSLSSFCKRSLSPCRALNIAACFCACCYASSLPDFEQLQRCKASRLLLATRYWKCWKDSLPSLAHKTCRHLVLHPPSAGTAQEL